MQLKTAAIMGFVCVLLNACSIATDLMPNPGYGVVIHAEPEPNASEKWGVRALANDGRHLFSFGRLHSDRASTSSYGGAGVPKWVQITWRKDVEPGQYWTTGTVIGDYRIDVASRIPPHVLKYASQGKGRAIYLIFRIMDDGALLAWSVQETVRAPNGGTGRVYSLFGGDFSCEEAGGVIKRQRCTAGYLKEAPWYDPLWTFI